MHEKLQAHAKGMILTHEELKSRIPRQWHQHVTFAGEGEAPGGAVGSVLHQSVVTQTLVVHVAL